MNSGNLIVKCAQCGTKNRVPMSKAGDRPVCGRCKTPLRTAGGYPDRIVEVNDMTFPGEVLSFTGPVVAYMWAPWCGHCARLNPVMEQIASDYAGKIKFTRLNIDQNRTTASRYNVQSVPTIFLFRNGSQLNRLAGALPRAEIEKYLQPLMQG